MRGLCALACLAISLAAFAAESPTPSVANPRPPDVAGPADRFALDEDEPTETRAKISDHLRHLARELSARGADRNAVLASRPSLLSNRLRRITDGGMVQCYVHYGNGPAAALAAVKRVGGAVELVSKEMSVVQARIPYDQMDALAANAAVRTISLPGYALTRTGSVNSQGDSVHRCDTVRSSFGLSGSGIKVGVISDGINGIGTSQASGDIPATYEAQSARFDGNLNAGPEGLAMMEIVHDLAPGAALAFSNPGTSAEMVNAIGILDSTFHCNVICDDLGFSDEPYFQDSAIVTRIDQATANGAIYCSAAGNDAYLSYYEGDFAGMTQTIGNKSMTVQNFNGAGDWNMTASVPANSAIVVILQWNDLWTASTNDYDLYLTNSTGTTVLTSSKDRQAATHTPLEIVQYTNNNSSSLNVYVVVRKYSGSVRHLKIVSWYGDLTEYSTATGSIYGHAAGLSTIACGAVRASTPGTIEYFSSRGPTRIDFPSLVYRNKPDLCGADGVSVTANGGFVTPFYGTSAAAPHVAAVAAQIWSYNPAMANTEVRNLLQTTAVDLGAAGYDTTYGYGRVDALNAANALLDQCPNDPDKTQPGQCGCGVADTDTDGDGVADCHDLCAGTVSGSPVDADGCPPAIPGDFNRDGAVDDTDLVLRHYSIEG